MLYSYRTIDEYLIENFKNNHLYLNKIQKMNDPYEGSFSIFVSVNLIDEFYNFLKERIYMPDEMKYDIEQMENDEKKASLLARVFESCVKNASSEHIGIYCFTKNKYSLPMWAHYANNHKGIMIEFDELNKIAQYAIPITYINTINEIKLIQKKDLKNLETVLYDSLSVKHLSWSYENEYRYCGKEGELLSYDSNFIKAIYFGMHCSNENKKMIKEANNLNKNIKYFNSLIMTGMYEVYYD